MPLVVEEMLMSGGPEEIKEEEHDSSSEDCGIGMPRLMKQRIEQ